MKFYLDSANLSEVQNGVKLGVFAGVTTNPSILAKEPKTDFWAHIKKITDIFKTADVTPSLSVEVFTKDPAKMVDQGLEIAERLQYPNLAIKIPVGWEELGAISALTKRNLKVNCTCIFTEAQALLAANAGAHYVSIFYARLRDVGGNPLQVISNVRNALDKNGSKAQIIVGSIRQPMDVTDSHLAGAHIVTAGFNVIRDLAGHPQTTKSVDGFIRDFEAWLK